MKTLLFAFSFLIMAGKSPYEKETYINDTYYEYCLSIGTEYEISPELLMAMVEIESSGDPGATNGDCKGLLQINEKFHKDRMKKNLCVTLYEPWDNLTVGADYLRELFDTYEDVGLVLSLYGGYSNAFELYQTGELSPYAEKVLTRAKELEEVHNKWWKFVDWREQKEKGEQIKKFQYRKEGN